ncbi:MAG: hypothetical protein KJN60_10090 [Boseongicola sp.]|nr:hypothetical protein [Boseongicola sp.]
MSDEQKIDFDCQEFLAKHEKWAKAEGSDASGAGKRREQIGKLAEKMGLENKALSQIRAGLKIKNEGKQLDWLRSMEAMLPEVAEHIRANATEEMSFGNVTNLAAE